MNRFSPMNRVSRPIRQSLCDTPIHCRVKLSARGKKFPLFEKLSNLRNFIGKTRERIPRSESFQLDSLETLRAEVKEFIRCEAALVPLFPPEGECMAWEKPEKSYF